MDGKLRFYRMSEVRNLVKTHYCENPWSELRQRTAYFWSAAIMTIFIIISCQRFLPLLHSMHGGRFSLKQSARQKQLRQIWTNAYHLSSQLEGSYHFNLTDILRNFIQPNQVKSNKYDLYLINR